MKKAVITLAIGDYFQKMGETTHPLIKRYATKIGADFIVISDNKISKTTPHWEKFQLLDYLNKYDRILYVDTDVLIKKTCPDIFEIVPEDSLGAFNEAPFTERRDIAIERISDDYGYKNFQWNGKYYNTGVLVLSKKHRSLFRKPEKEVSNFFEQSYFNLALIQQNTKMHDLDYKFNRMYCMDQFTGEERFVSHIIHYAGFWNPGMAMQAIEKDVKTLENLPEDYKPKRKIWLQVTGGMGDQIDAEPVTRFMCKYVYPGEDIRVNTHFPEIFKHLPVTVGTFDENLWKDCETQPFTRNTLPSPQTPQWRVVSNLLSHTVDFCSMAVLARTLPDEDKQIQMQVDEAALHKVRGFLNIDRNEALTNHVLVHAGRHWDSKTFPESWWQDIIDGLLEKDLIPILIGKNDETRGVVKINGRGKCIDLTDLLTTAEFFAIVSIVPILLSNDSSPIHVAGAFDNWIVLIPSCKHPDHILPWRYGKKNYKAVALYKKLVIDDIPSAPTEVNGSVADKVPGKYEDYLPTSKYVVECIHEIVMDYPKI